METVRDFINFIKTCPASREQFKTNKISPGNFQNAVNESEQVQQFISEDTDLVLDALVAADYINEIKCMDGSSQLIAWLTEKYNPDNYFTAVAEQLEIYNIDELGQTTGTVFQFFCQQ